MPLASPTQQITDQSLAERAAAGEHSAFREIMQRHNRKLYRVARGVLGGEAEVEDVLQDAYLLAFRHIRDFRGDSKLSTWLTRIVVNEALGRRRRRKETIELDRMDSMSELGQIIPFPPGDADPEHMAARAEVRRLLEQAIDGLPYHFRIVFIMRDVEDISTEETAEHLGLRTETVKTRLHRARRLLRTTLQRQLSDGMSDAYPFAGARCARIVETVLQRISEQQA
jgi:RNA polymerase sigma-70 factor (ECF subfamily)